MQSKRESVEVWRELELLRAAEQSRPYNGAPYYAGLYAPCLAVDSDVSYVSIYIVNEAPVVIIAVLYNTIYILVT